MPLNWMETDSLPFNSLLLLEQAQINWFPSFNLPLAEFATALRANPAVEWFLRHKCPNIEPWLEDVLQQHPNNLPDLREAEKAVLRKFVDLLVYALNPEVYDEQPFLNWDSDELTSLLDFTGKTVIDVGSGTGRQAFIAAVDARVVYAVEPVTNLRNYIRQKAASRGVNNLFTVDGLITCIPFLDGFADVTMGGHVFGDEPEAEWAELKRVTRYGGMVILCPGNDDVDNEIHQFLIDQGCDWGRFEEPRDGWKRKYWLVR
ncbi:MAG: class I SAM-dependent methyltransferase [Chloroflexi bacterium]|nr:class I SAM-dependent methyltransferase [Chloroflexota bacterium]